LSISDAWADDATTDAGNPVKTLVRWPAISTRHDFLGDGYCITAIKPWDGKAAKDPAVKSLINDGVAQLDQDAERPPQGALCRRYHGKMRSRRLLQRTEQERLLPEDRGDLVVSLTTRRGLAEVRLRGLLRRTWRLHQARLRRHRLAAEGLGSERSGRNHNGKIRSE
jgi:hypothetical protein